MEFRYANAISRLLSRRERRPAVSQELAPLVIEPLRGNLVADLFQLMTSHSAQIQEDVSRFGAVLLRGFDVRNAAQFEQTVLATRGMRGISRVFMSEEGRDLIPGTQFVLHTNTKYRTGGGVFTMSFHTENYYTPDVPRYISFACFVPPVMGGETALVNMAGLYSDLPARLKERLVRKACLASEWRMVNLAERYQLTMANLVAKCAEAGMAVETRDGEEYLRMYKPSVLVHPETGEECLATNLTVETCYDLRFFSGLRRSLRPDYRGLRWSVHRFLWDRPHLAGPETSLRAFALRLVKGALAARADEVPDFTAWRRDRVFQDLTEEETDLLAEATCRRMSMVQWQRGDIMIVDNVKMAHGGMPGFGPREIRAMICNPFILNLSESAPGRQQVPSGIHDTMGDRIAALQ